MTDEFLPSRRMVIGSGSALLGLGMTEAGPVLAQAAQSTDSPPNKMIVTLLGTGMPAPSPTRFGPATLVQAGDVSLLFDAGRACTIRTVQIGFGLARLDGVFLTHFHSDHIGGLFDLFTFGYLARRQPDADVAVRSVRTGPLRLWGPTGTSKIALGVEMSAAADINIRIADENVDPNVARIETHEFDKDGVVFDEKGVTVTAFMVNHGGHVRPAYGYRVDYGGRSVLISGDTRPNENLIAHGSGLDLMIHSVAAIGAKYRDNPSSRATGEHQSSPEDCAGVFQRTRPKLAAFTHIITQGTTDAEIVPRARAIYGGPMVLGEDLMRFTIGDTVLVQRWDNKSQSYPT